MRKVINITLAPLDGDGTRKARGVYGGCRGVDGYAKNLRRITGKTRQDFAGNSHLSCAKDIFKVWVAILRPPPPSGSRIPLEIIVLYPLRIPK